MTQAAAFLPMLRLAVPLAALITSLTTPARAATWSQLVIFGDSLSDTGNLGRFAPGRLWDEYLASALGVAAIPSSHGGTNYAMAGALYTADNGQALSLPHQAASYLQAHPKADARGLYVIWGGANDVFSTIPNPSAAPSVQAAGIAATTAMLRTLYAAGARSFILGNVPRVDFTPYIRAQGTIVAAQQARMVQSWNVALPGAIAQLHLRGARILLYNSGASLRAVFTTPGHFGFKNITTPCGTTCPDPARTFFFDDRHPGTTEHAAIGAEVLALTAQN